MSFIRCGSADESCLPGCPCNSPYNFDCCRWHFCIHWFKQWRFRQMVRKSCKTCIHTSCTPGTVCFYCEIYVKQGVVE
jgi:hypothetical protein